MRKPPVMKRVNDKEIIKNADENRKSFDSVDSEITRLNKALEAALKRIEQLEEMP